MPESRLRIWVAVLPATVLPCLASLFYFVWFSSHGFARVIYGGTKVFTIVWPVLAVWLICRCKLPKPHLADRRHIRAVPLGLLTGAAIVALMFGLMATPLGDMALNSASRIRAKAEDLGLLEHYWSFAIFLSVIHSLIEEYYWRWFVFGRMAEVMSVPLAHALAGVAFAAHHVVVATQFFPLGWGVLFGSLVGIGGVVWSVHYRKQCTLAGAWVSHLVVDLGLMTIGHRLIFGSYF
jgi:CAAX protease family protein